MKTWTGLCGLVVVALLASGVMAQVALTQASVYLEDSPAAQELVDQAQRLIGQDRLAEAAAVYQRVIHDHGRKLMPVSDAIHTDAAQWVCQAIVSNPHLLKVYRRLYEPAAERALAQACTPRANVEALERVVSTYGLCPSAYEAGLRLAAFYLEQGNPAYAGTVLLGLKDHPDGSSQQIRWHELQAAIGLYGGREDQYRLHLEALGTLADRNAVARVQSWPDRLRLPQPRRAVSGFDVLGGEVPIPDTLGPPLWEKQMTTGADSTTGAVGAHFGRPAPAGGRRLGHYYPMVPVVHGDQMVVADTASVVALDRSSGRQLWSYRPEDSPAKASQVRRLRALSIRSLFAFDQRAVMIRGDHLVTVLGVPSAVRPGLTREVDGTWLVCLDRTSGRVRWRANTHDLDPSLEAADFFGTPLSGFDSAFVLVRREQHSGFEDSYVVAVDITTGRLLWRRHLFSIAAGRQAARGSVQMIVRDGRLFVADNLGNTACIEARNGAIVWLSVLGQLPEFQVERGARTGTSMIGWPPSRPVWLDAGLLVMMRSGRQSGSGAALLDPATGQMRRLLNAPQWLAAWYAVGAPGGVLLVGPTMQLLDGHDLQPRWRHELDRTAGKQPGGLAAVTQDRALIPVDQWLLVLDLDDGKIVGQHALKESGNVLALPDQVVIAGAQSVRGYLPWARAYEQLSKQIVDAPDDPRPALALAHLSLAAKKDDVVVEAVDQAIAALARQGRIAASGHTTTWQDSLQRQVFEHLYDLVASQQIANPALRRQLFDRLATVTAGAADEVAYHLALGAFLAQSEQPAAAVDHYQAVLNDPALSAQIYHHETGWRQGGIEAKTRLVKLIEEFGQGVYARYEAEAAQQMAELSAVDEPDASALIELARRYALSRAAPVAMLAAAQALAREGQERAAVGQLRRAYRHATELGLIQQMIGLMAQLYERAGQPGRAARWLQRAQRDHPQLRPLRHGVPESIDVWLQRLAKRSASDRHLPELNLPLGQPFRVSGRLLVPRDQPRSDWPRDCVVTLDGRWVQLCEGPGLEKRWQWQGSSDDATLLAITDEQVLLWFDRSGTLVALNAQTGRHAWPPVHGLALMQQMGGRREQVAAPQVNGQIQWMVGPRGEHVNGQDADPGWVGASGLRVAVNEMVACLADTGGRVTGVDLRTGRVLWRSAGSLTGIGVLAIDDDVVVLAGKNAGLADEPAAEGILVLDAMTGEPVFPMLTNKEGVRWVGLSGEGLLAYANPDRVVVHDLRTGQVEWGLDVDDLMFQGRGWMGHDLMVLLLDQFGGSILVIKPSTGQIINRVTGLFPDLKRHLTLQPVEDRWYLLSPLRSMVIGVDGSVLWPDAVFRDVAERGVLQWVSRPFVVLLTQLELGDDGHANYRLYLLDRASGAIQYQRTLGPLDRPIQAEQAVLLHNRLVLTTGDETLVIPGGDRPH